MNNTDIKLDPINLFAIEWLEQHGNKAPNEKQINLVEIIVKYQLGILEHAIFNYR